LQEPTNEDLEGYHMIGNRITSCQYKKVGKSIVEA
jgi:hypothetical protein